MSVEEEPICYPMSKSEGARQNHRSTKKNQRRGKEVPICYLVSHSKGVRQTLILEFKEESKKY